VFSFHRFDHTAASLKIEVIAIKLCFVPAFYVNHAQWRRLDAKAALYLNDGAFASPDLMNSNFF